MVDGFYLTGKKEESKVNRHFAALQGLQYPRKIHFVRSNDVQLYSRKRGIVREAAAMTHSSF